jgi:hypothetical protein
LGKSVFVIPEANKQGKAYNDCQETLPADIPMIIPQGSALTEGFNDSTEDAASHPDEKKQDFETAL